MVVVDIAETVVARSEFTKTTEVKKNVLHIEALAASTTNTITISEFTTIGTAALWKKSDSSSVTCTWATNVITITGTISSVDLGGIVVEA